MSSCRARRSHGPWCPTPASYLTKTGKKVRKAATKLGYRVHYPVRSLTDQRSDLVGVVAAGRDNPFRALQIDHLTRALLRRNVRPVLLPVDETYGKVQGRWCYLYRAIDRDGNLIDTMLSATRE
jgi:hypothetical protein